MSNASSRMSSGLAPPLPDGLPGLTRWVRGAVLLGAAVLLVVPPWFWLSPTWVTLAAPQLSGLAAHALVVDDRARALGALASAPALAVGGWMLWRLWTLFGLYAAGEVFSAAAVRALHGFARALLAAAALGPVVQAAMSVIFTLGNPPGQRMLGLSLDWDDYLLALLALVLLAITRVMAGAVALADENRGFV